MLYLSSFSLIFSSNLREKAVSIAISKKTINRATAKKGMMFAHEVTTKEQSEGVDVYTLPAGLYLRVLNDTYAAQLMFGREKCHTHELFGMCGRNPELGLAFHGEGGQEMEYRSVERNPDGTRIEYAYIPVRRKEKI